MGSKCCTQTQDMLNENFFTIETNLNYKSGHTISMISGGTHHKSSDSSCSFVKTFSEKITKEEEDMCKTLKPLKKKIKKKIKKIIKKSTKKLIPRLAAASDSTNVDRPTQNSNNTNPTVAEIKKTINTKTPSSQEPVNSRNKNKIQRNQSQTPSLPTSSHPLQTENQITMNVLDRTVRSFDSEEDNNCVDEEYDDFPDQPERSTYDLIGETGFKFEILNRKTSKGMYELDVVDKKRNKLERISFKISLANLNLEYHANAEFLIEILYTNTDNPRDFFTLGCTQITKNNNAKSLDFDEDIEIDFLFERIQFIRLIVYTSNGIEGEITVNINKIIKSNLEEIRYPLDLVNGDAVLYTANSFNENKQEISLKFKRITEGLDILIPNFQVEFNFNSASIIANRLKYEILIETVETEVILIHQSNELLGKNPLYFSMACLEDKSLFQVQGIKYYIFEFYQNDEYFGQIVLEKEDMERILMSENHVSFDVLAGCQRHKERYKPTRLVHRYANSGQYTRESNNSRKSQKILSKVLDLETDRELNVIDELDKIGGRSEKKKLTTLSQFSQFAIKKTKEATLGTKKTQSAKSLVNIRQQSDDPKTKKILGTAAIYFFERRRKTFFDQYHRGLRLQLSIAIDFTSSNLDPTHPKSLHTRNPLNENQYANSIRYCEKILKEYSRTNEYSVFGFGGLPENSQVVSHCFNLNGKKDATISGIDEVIKSYYNCLSTVKLVGPSYFKFILKTLKEQIKKTIKTDCLNYHVFLILTDGRVDDMIDTVDEIIEMSKLPVSVIVVGVGSSDFGKMQSLEGQEFDLYSSQTGEKIFRNIVTFVKYIDYESDQAVFVEKMLEKIPEQIEEYTKMKGV